MGYWAGYMFLNDAALRPIWETPWSTLLRRYGEVRRETVRETLAQNLDCDAKTLARILRDETVKETLGRADWFTLFEVVYRLQEPKHHLMVSGGCGYRNGAESVVAAATGAFARGRLGRATLKAVCRLYGIAAPQDMLKLPPPLRKKVGRVLTSRELSERWYDWQSPENRDDGGGLLGVADTRRFMAFVDRAWRENWPIPPYVRDQDDFGHFRDEEAAVVLKKLVARARRFERPLALFMVT